MLAVLIGSKESHLAAQSTGSRHSRKEVLVSVARTGLRRVFVMHQGQQHSAASPAPLPYLCMPEPQRSCWLHLVIQGLHIYTQRP